MTIQKTARKRPRMTEAAWSWVSTRTRLSVAVDALRGETDPEIKAAAMILSRKLAEMDDAE